MIRRIFGAAVLLAAAIPAHAYQIRAVYEEGTTLEEADGHQLVSVQVDWEAGDSAGACLMDVTVSAQAFSNPGFNEATPGEDYIPTTETLSFSVSGSDALSQSFQVPVIDDALVEPTQTFTAVITEVQVVDCAPEPAINRDTAERSFPIFDDDVGAVTASVDQSSVMVNEDAGSVTLGVTLTGTETVEGQFFVSVPWALADGSATLLADYGEGEPSGSFELNENNLSQTLTVPIADDADLEDLEDFTFAIADVFGLHNGENSLPVAVAAGTSTVQIVDDDGPGELSFADEPFEADESAGSATVTLRRSGGTAGTFTAYYRAVDGSATGEADFEPVSGSVTWSDGDAEDKTITVPVLDDAEGEGNETVLIRAGTDSDFVEYLQTTLTIVDDEGLATAGFATTTATAEENAEEVVVTLARSGSTTGSVSVDYATADGTAIAGEDYAAAAGTVTWADGDGADKTLVIALIEDGEEEDAEDFVVNLSNVTGPATLGSNGAITVTIDASDLTRDIAGIADLSPNQLALAQWFDRTCGRIDGVDAPSADQLDLAGICGALRDAGNDDAAVREALDAINPEELLVSSFNALRLTALQHGNLSQRLNALRNGATGLNLVGLNLEIDGQQIAGRALQEMFNGLVGGGASADEAGGGRWGGFVNGRLAAGDQDRSDDEAGFDFDLYSVTLGVDYRVRQNVIVGISAGFGSVDTDYQSSGGGMDIDSWNGAAYLTWFRDESFYFDGLATYGRNDYESRRHIGFGSVQRVGLGETDGTQWSLGFGTGWDFSRGAWTFGPHVGGYFFDVEVDGFAESGAGGLNVAVDDQGSQSLTANAGGHVSYAWLTDWGVLVPNAKVDWVHEFEDNREALSFRFVNDPFAGDPSDPSPTITLQSNRPDSDYAIWSVGVSAQFIHGFSGFVNYQAYGGYGDISLGEWSMGARWEKMF